MNRFLIPMLSVVMLLMAAVLTALTVRNRLYADDIVLGKMGAIKMEFSAAQARAFGQPSSDLILTEFSDFSCPYCRRYDTSLIKIMRSNPGTFVYRRKDFPLTRIHPLAFDAAVLNKELSRQNPSDPIGLHEAFISFRIAPDFLAASTLIARAGANERGPGWQTRSYAEVLADITLGRSLGINSTPTYFITTGGACYRMPSFASVTAFLEWRRNGRQSSHS